MSDSSSSKAPSAVTDATTSAHSAVPEKWVVCPTCKGESLYAARNRYRPFCSERCKNIDLGAWASESFAVPAEAPPEDQIYGDAKLQ
jgi:hypothetical protein